MIHHDCLLFKINKNKRFFSLFLPTCVTLDRVCYHFKTLPICNKLLMQQPITDNNVTSSQKYVYDLTRNISRGKSGIIYKYCPRHFRSYQILKRQYSLLCPSHVKNVCTPLIAIYDACRELLKL